MAKTPLEIRPDITSALEDLDELRRLAGVLGFDLAGHLDGLADRLAPVLTCEVDDSAAMATGYAIARYKLAEELNGALAALRAWNGHRESGKRIGHREPPEIEITTKMISAGVLAYNKRDSRFMMDKDIVEDIFMSMLEARLKSSEGNL